jgi:hypothetical protein
MITYCCEFEMDGRRYVQNIEAESDEDVEKRIKSIKQSLVLLGELKGIIQATDDQVHQTIAKQQARRNEKPKLRVVKGDYK